MVDTGYPVLTFETIGKMGMRGGFILYGRYRVLTFETIGKMGMRGGFTASDLIRFL